LTAVVELSGGQNVERYFRDLAQKVQRGGTLKVGFLANATYPDGKQVALIAAFNEFGTAKAPPRPFFRNMIANKSKGWGPSAASLLKQTGYDVRVTLDFVGQGIAGQLAQSITDLMSPPLAESTVKRKGFSKPLVDTGHMRNSISYDVSIK
jgi:GNAT superfamily N-acetyltransferase